MISVVLPTQSPPECPLTRKSLQLMKPYQNELEIIFVPEHSVHSRAGRINLGVQASRNDWILLHHPRTYIESQGIEKLIELSKKNTPPSWGGFIHSFINPTWPYQAISWYSNRIRAQRKRILYLDHCPFFHRQLWQKDLPDVDIFEDTILSYRLAEHSAPMILPFKSITSKIRFRTNGLVRQTIKNQSLKLAFHLGIDSQRLNRSYEKGLFLNSNYPKQRS